MFLKKKKGAKRSRLFLTVFILVDAGSKIDLYLGNGTLIQLPPYSSIIFWVGMQLTQDR